MGQALALAVIMNNGRRSVWIVLLVMISLLQQACGTGEYNLPTPTEVESDVVSSTILDTTLDPLEETTLITAQSATVMARRPLSYLEAVVPPCVPLEGSVQDPCPLITPTRVEAPVGATTTLLRDLPSFATIFLGYEVSSIVPHMVVRGTVQSDTFRCDIYPIVRFDHDQDHTSSYIIEEHVDYYCFMEVRINEYLVGNGPPNLTISFYHKLIDRPISGGMPIVEEQIELDAYSRVSEYEGKELVMFLGIPPTTAVEVWEVSSFFRSLWFVQQHEDEVRAVARYIHRATTDELRSQMNLPLDELVRQIKEAAEERLVLTGGRIGVDPGLPMLVTDANKLQDFYQQTGAVYEGEGATVLPPPVPGAEDSDQTPTTTGAIQLQIEETTTTASTTEPEDESATVMARRPVSYLEDIIPPCVPLEGSKQDTCPVVTPPRVQSPVNVTTTLLRYLPTLTDILIGNLGGGLATPHIIVRATIKPDTTRCDIYPSTPFAHDPDQGDTWFYDEYALYICFMEARVNEYIVGEGPSELTVAVQERLVSWSELGETSIIPEDDKHEVRSKISVYPGKELVMFLGPVWTTSVEAWYIQPRFHSLWYVQRNESEVRAVSDDVKFTNNPDLLSQMNMPLDELVRQIKEAAEERLVLTEGRIGVDPGLPMLVTDANKLQDFYQQTGAVYEGEGATVLPPPVPGAEDPELPPTRTGEGQPDPDPPVPGEEEASPPPTDDAATTTSTGTTQPQVEDITTTTVSTGPEDELATTTSTGTTRPQVEDTTTTSTPPDEGTTTTGTTRPQAGETTTTTSAQPGADNGVTTVPAVDVDATQQQAEETTSTTTETTQPPDEGTTTLPQTEDAIPTPTGTTRPSAEGSAPSSDAPAPGST